MAIPFYRTRGTGTVWARICVYATIRPDIEMLAMIWLDGTIEKGPPPSKRKFEAFVAEQLRIHGEGLVEKVGFNWGDDVEDAMQNDPEEVKKQLAATMAKIRELYGIEE